MTIHRRLFVQGAIASAAATFAGIAPAQQAPSRELARILVGFAPGGMPDVISRRVAVELAGSYARAVVVENKAGAGGQLAVTELARRAGFPDVIRMSAIRNGQVRQGERVIVVDVIGELFKVYSLADVVFCGGSLVPKGGQNLLEAAAWGKVVFYGPFMDDFRDERALLEEAGAGMTVRNREELSDGILGLLDHPDLLREKGEAGRKAVAANRGAAARYAELIAGQLK